MGDTGCYDFFNVHFPLTWRADTIADTHQVSSLPSYGLRPGAQVAAALAALDRAAARLGLRPAASSAWRQKASGQRFRTYAFGDATDREYFSVMLDPDFTPSKTCVAQVENTLN